MVLIDKDQLKKFKKALADIIVSSQGLCTYDACKDVAEREATFLISILLPELNTQSSNIKETIRKEIERLDKHYIVCEEYDCGWNNALNAISEFLDTLPEQPDKRGYKDCNGCEYNRTLKDQIGWQFRGCFGGDYKGKPIAEIELCPLKVAQQEQPMEGLEEELKRYINSDEYINTPENTTLLIARHFAEWGKNNLK